MALIKLLQYGKLGNCANNSLWIGFVENYCDPSKQLEIVLFEDCPELL
jgi:hypothetical protein